MPRYLATRPLEFCGETYKQNDYINVPDQPSEAEARELERLHSNASLRRVPAEPPTPGASREENRAMEAEPKRQGGYKTRGR